MRTLFLLRPIAAPTSALVAATVLLGCSSSITRFNDGPTWSLTGGKDAVPPPSAPSLAGRPEPTYRGGRDPVTGRATAQSGAAVGVAAAPPPDSRFQAPPPRPYDQAATAPQAPSRSAAAAQLGSNTYGRRVVTVQPGDSLASIATTQRVSIASLMFANNLRDAYVSPGQQLVIPPR